MTDLASDAFHPLTLEDWRRWLSANRRTSTGVWLVTRRRAGDAVVLSPEEGFGVVPDEAHRRDRQAGPGERSGQFVEKEGERTMKTSLVAHRIAGGSAARNPWSFLSENSVTLVLRLVEGGAM